ncbi:MAG: hypothetical protein ACAI34_02550 [Verrucomicrobium sp.]
MAKFLRFLFFGVILQQITIELMARGGSTPPIQMIGMAGLSYAAIAFLMLFGLAFRAVRSRWLLWTLAIGLMSGLAARNILLFQSMSAAV